MAPKTWAVESRFWFSDGYSLMKQRRGKRLTVRPLAARDYLVWKQAHTELPPQKNIWDQKIKPIQDLSKIKFREILKSQKALADSDKYLDFSVFLNATGELIGHVALMDIVRGISHSAFLGYRIFNPHWGKSYGKEAVALAIQIAFKDIKLHRIEAGIEPSNRRSIMLARALGLRKEGLKKRAIFLRNQWVDLTIYSATCEDFGIKWQGKTKDRLR